MRVETFVDPSSRRMGIMVDINYLESNTGRDVLLRSIIDKVSEVVAEKFLADHLQEVLQHLDPQAIANLAVADSAAGIREALHKKLPNKILEIVRTEDRVYQKGLFGGLTRIR